MTKQEEQIQMNMSTLYRSTEQIDKAVVKINENFSKGLISDDLYDKAFEQLDEVIQKAKITKYFKREGTKGNYKYYYTESDYNKAKGDSGADKNIRTFSSSKGSVTIKTKNNRQHFVLESSHPSYEKGDELNNVEELKSIGLSEEKSKNKPKIDDLENYKTSEQRRVEDKKQDNKEDDFSYKINDIFQNIESGEKFFISRIDKEENWVYTNNLDKPNSSLHANNDSRHTFEKYLRLGVNKKTGEVFNKEKN